MPGKDRVVAQVVSGGGARGASKLVHQLTFKSEAFWNNRMEFERLQVESNFMNLPPEPFPIDGIAGYYRISIPYPKMDQYHTVTVDVLLQDHPLRELAELVRKVGRVVPHSMAVT